MPRNGRNATHEKQNPAIVAAWIGAAAVIVGGLITALSPSLQDWIKTRFVAAKPTPTPPPITIPLAKKTKKSLCNNPATGQPYSFDITPFDPVQYTHLDQPFGGDAVNRGHKFYLPQPVGAPGPVLGGPYTHCAHGGTSEEITYCGPLRSAKGQPTNMAEIEGWINGQGGLTSMTVAYQMPCEVPDDGN